MMLWFILFLRLKICISISVKSVSREGLDIWSNYHQKKDCRKQKSWWISTKIAAILVFIVINYFLLIIRFHSTTQTLVLCNSFSNHIKICLLRYLFINLNVINVTTSYDIVISFLITCNVGKTLLLRISDCNLTPKTNTGKRWANDFVLRTSFKNQAFDYGIYELNLDIKPALTQLFFQSSECLT